jgi:hypothetical protein
MVQGGVKEFKGYGNFIVSHVGDKNYLQKRLGNWKFISFFRNNLSRKNVSFSQRSDFICQKMIPWWSKNKKFQEHTLIQNKLSFWKNSGKWNSSSEIDSCISMLPRKSLFKINPWVEDLNLKLQFCFNNSFTNGMWNIWKILKNETFTMKNILS